MNKQDLNPEEAKLDALLHESRATPPLPPRFRENVWRRIEKAEAPNAVASENWLDTVASWILRPRRAVAVAAVLVLAGTGLGWSKGERLAREQAQERYVAVVAPNILR